MIAELLVDMLHNRGLRTNNASGMISCAVKDCNGVFIRLTFIVDNDMINAVFPDMSNWSLEACICISEPGVDIENWVNSIVDIVQHNRYSDRYRNIYNNYNDYND